MNYDACEGYRNCKRCRNKAAFRHVSDIGEQPAGSGFSFVARVRLCRRCSERMDKLLGEVVRIKPGRVGPA